MLAVQPGHDRFFVPYVQQCGQWEPAESQILLRGLRPGMRVIDVGAHVGYFSVLCALRVRPGGTVHAFEPAPAHLRLLRANLLLNDCSEVEVHALALSDRSEQRPLHLCMENPGDHRLQAIAGRETVLVEAATLDDVLGNAHVDFMKVDTQGWEAHVLLGMAACIARNRAHLGMLIEFAPGLLAQAGCSVADFAQHLLTLDARVFAVEWREGGTRLVPLQSPAAALQERAERLAQHGREDESTNLFLVFSESARKSWLDRLALD